MTEPTVSVNLTRIQVDQMTASLRSRQRAAEALDDYATVADCEERIDKLLDSRKWCRG